MNGRWLRRVMTVGLPVCLLATSGIRASAHIEDNYKSVHFHSGHPDFGTVPRRYIVSGWEQCDRQAYNGMSGPTYSPDRNEEPDYDDVDKQRQAEAWLFYRARKSCEAGRWQAALGIYEHLAAKHPRWGTLRDRVEVIRRSQSMPQPLEPKFAAAMKRYMRGLPERDDQEESFGEIYLEHVYMDRTARFLRAHALYQLGCAAYQARNVSRAIHQFRRVGHEFPGHPNVEAALIMAARAAILSDPPADPTAGKAALQQLLKDFPHTRFRPAALGLFGRLHYRAGRYSDAFWCYLENGDMESAEIVRKKLPDAQQGVARVRLMEGYLLRLARAMNGDGDRYERSLHAISRTRKEFDALDSIHFSRRLLMRPKLAAPYFYYRIYHGDFKRGDPANLAHLADRIAARYSKEALPPDVRVRIAEVYYQRRAYRKGLAWAESAMRTQTTDRGHFVRGAIRQKLGRNREAIADFRAILHDYPHSYLRHGAREELAILYEAVGDWAGALDQYFALDYRADIAFLLDGRMPLDDVIRYYNRTPSNETVRFESRMAPSNNRSWAPGLTPPIRVRQLLAYTVGIRLLRAERWDEAARWLRPIPRSVYVAFSEGRRKWEDSASPDPLIAALELGRLQRAANRAPTAERKAAALFSYATYYYKHGLLLLYNPVLWQGDREMCFDFWWNTRHATPADERAARAYMYEHEVYAHAAKICTEIADRYPQTTVAPRALYRAATAAAHLHNLNGWWRGEESEHHNNRMRAANLMRRLAKRYPNHPLAAEAAKFARVWSTEAYAEAATRRRWATRRATRRAQKDFPWNSDT